MILDIGPVTQKNIMDIIDKSKTVIWNGPLGAFETPPFDVKKPKLISFFNFDIFR